MDARELSTYLSVSEVARALGLSQGTVNVLLRQGDLPCISTTLGRLIAPADLEAYRLLREELTRGAIRMTAGR